MSDPLPRIRAGDKLPGIPAEGWNAAMDAAQYVRDARLAQGVGGVPAFRQPGVVLVKNVSGADVERFGVLALGDALLDPDDEDALPEYQRQVAVEGDVADAGETLVGVLLEPIPEDGIGRAVVAGACVAKVRVTSDSHEFAAPDGANTEYMASGTSGPARIFYRPPGAEPYEALCYVLLGGGSGGGSSVVHGVLDEELAFNGDAVMSVWGDGADTGTNVTVNDWVLADGQTVAAGTRVVAALDATDGLYYLVAASCATPD